MAASKLEAIRTVTDKSLESLTHQDLEKLLNELDQERVELKSQITRVRQHLNRKLQDDHISSTYGSQLADLVKQIGPEQAQKLIQDTHKQLQQSGKNQTINIQPIQSNQSVLNVLTGKK